MTTSVFPVVAVSLWSSMRDVGKFAPLVLLLRAARVLLSLQPEILF